MTWHHHHILRAIEEFKKGDRITHPSATDGTSDLYRGHAHGMADLLSPPCTEHPTDVPLFPERPS